MRQVTKREAKQRGCEYCLDGTVTSELGVFDRERLQNKRKKMSEMRRKGYNVDSVKSICCPYGRCPYRELDGLVDYDREMTIGHTIKNVVKTIVRGVEKEYDDREAM